MTIDELNKEKSKTVDKVVDKEWKNLISFCNVYICLANNQTINRRVEFVI
jgi:hypothetical protein